jgi:hypothetical protein
MGTRSITVDRFQEIERRLQDGRVPDDVFLESSGKKDGIFAKPSCINSPYERQMPLLIQFEGECRVAQIMDIAGLLIVNGSGLRWRE